MPSGILGVIASVEVPRSFSSDDDRISSAITDAVRGAVRSVLRPQAALPPADAVRLLQPLEMGFGRKRREDDEEAVAGIDAPEHAWWAAAPSDPLIGLADRFPDPEPESLEEPDEATATGARPRPRPRRATPDRSTPDPYDILRVHPDAEWDEIVRSYRRLARWWHPDGLAASSAEEREACDEKIRELNEAYAELRLRRGR